MKKRETVPKGSSVNEIHQAFTALKIEARTVAEEASQIKTTTECRRALQRALGELDERMGIQEENLLEALNGAGGSVGVRRGKVRQLVFLQSQTQAGLAALKNRLSEARQSPGTAGISRIPSCLRNSLPHN